MSSQNPGLTYPLKAPDEFSATFAKFTEAIALARKEFAGLRAELARGGASSKPQLDEEALARKRNAAALKEEARQRKQSAKDEKDAALAGAKATSDKARVDIAASKASALRVRADNEVVKSQAAVTRATAEGSAAQSRADAATSRASAAASRASVARASASRAANAATARGINSVTAAARAQKPAIDDAEESTGRWLFTFRRLVGIFAVFALVRGAIGAVRDTIRSGIEFNRTLEDITLGIASLLVSVGQVRNAFGEAVKPSEQLALAQREARRQVGLLRVEALRTSATFKGLAETFQIAVGPGLAAGLNLEQIRRLTVAISQSAAALGLPQNQLPEEIRSLLTQSIQQRTTRIASALGITNEDIRQAKEAGVLAEFLERKFKAFSLAAQEAQGNFSVVLSNLQDGFEQLIGTGSLGFFTELKGLLQDLLGTLTQVSATDVTINPRAAEIVAAIAAGIQTAAEQARAFVREVGSDNLLRIAQGFGNIIGALARVLNFGAQTIVEFGGGISVVVNALSDVVNYFRKVLPDLSGIVGFTLKWYLTTKLLAGTLAIVGKLIAPIGKAIVAIALAGSAAGGDLGAPIGGGLLKFLKTGNGLVIVAGLLVGLFTAVGSAIAKAGDETREMATSVKDVKTSLAEIPSIVQTSNQPLRDNGELLKKLTEELNKALDNLRDTIATLGIKGSTAEDIKTLLGINSSLRDQGKELLSDLNKAQNQRVGLLEKEQKIQKDINALGAAGKQLFELTLPLSKEQVKLRDRQLVLEQEIKGATGTEKSALQTELADVLDKAEKAEQAIRSLQNRMASPESVTDPGIVTVASFEEAVKIQRAVQDLVVDELATKGQIVATDAQINSLTEQRSRLIAEIADIEINKVLASAIKEEEVQRRRLGSERALLNAQRARAAFATFEESRGFRTGQGSQALASAQAEQIIAKQRLEELALEQRAEEEGITRGIELIKVREIELRTVSQTAELEEDRTKAATALGSATRARAELEAKLAATQQANSTQIQTERLKVNAILLEALFTIRKTSTLEAEAAKVKTAGALASLEAEHAKLRIVEAEESRRFRVAESEKSILELQADLAPARARAALRAQDQRNAERELESEVLSLKVARDRAGVDVDFAGTAEGQAAAREEFIAVTNTLTAAEARLAAVRRQGNFELFDAHAKEITTQRTALANIARQAEQERISADQRLRTATAALAIENARSDILKRDAETGFRLSESAKRLLEIQSDTSAAETRLQITREEQQKQEELIDGTIKAASAFERELTAEKGLIENTDRQAAIQETINATVRVRTGLEKQLGAIRLANLADLGTELAKLRNANNEVVGAISAEAVTQTRSLRTDTKKTEAENLADRQRLEVQGRRLIIDGVSQTLSIEEKIKIAQADLGPMNAQIEAQKTLNQEKITGLKLTLDTLKGNLTRDEAALGTAKPEEKPALEKGIALQKQAILDLETQITAQEGASNAELDAMNFKLEEGKRKLRELQLIGDEPFAQGAKLGIDSFVDKASDGFTQMAELAEHTMNALADTISNSIVDAFDPNRKSTIKERFQKFFADLAREIAALIIKLQIAAALKNLGFGAGGAAEGGQVGKVAGGYVPRTAPRPSLAHLTHAKGFAMGGRPRGLDPRDTVPIWTQPGEWVMRLSAVQKYGSAAMAAINQGTVDASSLRSVTDGARARVSSATTNRVGYASGGGVTQVRGSSAERPSQLIGVVVATEEQARRLKQGGRRAELDFLRENRDEAKAALGI